MRGTSCFLLLVCGVIGYIDKTVSHLACPDEAHKGTGEFSYAKVVRYMMAKNPHFRILALTATPGGNPEAVQAIIDSLHIGRIEIRDEQSWDIREYINKKVTYFPYFASLNLVLINLGRKLSSTS